MKAQTDHRRALGTSPPRLPPLAHCGGSSTPRGTTARCPAWTTAARGGRDTGAPPPLAPSPPLPSAPPTDATADTSTWCRDSLSPPGVTPPSSAPLPQGRQQAGRPPTLAAAPSRCHARGHRLTRHVASSSLGLGQARVRGPRHGATNPRPRPRAPTLTLPSTTHAGIPVGRLGGEVRPSPPQEERHAGAGARSGDSQGRAGPTRGGGRQHGCRLTAACPYRPRPPTPTCIAHSAPAPSLCRGPGR